MVLGRDPDMRRNVPTAPLLAPQPKVRERTHSRRREACLKNKVQITHTHNGIALDEMRSRAINMYCQFACLFFCAVVSIVGVGERDERNRSAPVQPAPQQTGFGLD